MPALTNPKHERFAQELAKGEPACQAYVAAGYAYNEGNAVRLKGNEKVTARVAELLERSAIRVEITTADIVQMLHEDRRLARDNAQASAAIAASLGIAKVLGLVVDKTEVSGKDGEAIKYEASERASAFDRLVSQLAARTQAGQQLQ